MMILGLFPPPHESGSSNKPPTPTLLPESDPDRTALCTPSFKLHGTTPSSCQKQKHFPAASGHDDHYNLYCTITSAEVLKYGKKQSV